jgi:geranylgeranyl reductase
MADLKRFDTVVVGGGPAGATAAHDLAEQGHAVMLLERGGKIKPCGGAIPPRLIRDFAIPEDLIVARANTARMVSPAGREVDMPINGGSVGMVDREHFDEWLRERAEGSGAVRVTGSFERIERTEAGHAVVVYKTQGQGGASEETKVLARTVIGADGARSKVGQQEIGGGEHLPCVFAYHEIIRSPQAVPGSHFEADRCDIYYQGRLSPDFYAWVFPHGDTTSVGVGSAKKGFSLKGAVATLRQDTDLGSSETIRREGAPIPLKPRKKWDNGKDVMLAGDAAGCVAPASGEGIYYAMLGGRKAAEGIAELLATGDVKAMARARRSYLKEHGKVFFILGIMQHFWYRSDKRRERFVNICRDKDVQRLTWEAYMNKRLVKANPMAHIRIFLLDLGHLLGIKSLRS